MIVYLNNLRNVGLLASDIVVAIGFTCELHKYHNDYYNRRKL